jgi:hypothetical protein
MASGGAAHLGDPQNGAQIVAVANLSSNSSTPTTLIFAEIAAQLYPQSLQR